MRLFPEQLFAFYRHCEIAV